MEESIWLTSVSFSKTRPKSRKHSILSVSVDAVQSLMIIGKIRQKSCPNDVFEFVGEFVGVFVGEFCLWLPVEEEGEEGEGV